MGKKLKALKKRESKKGIKYLTRNQILKKLHLSLADFRRMCILKGIYPRDPPKKLYGNSKTYYLTKDINFLRYDPLLPLLQNRAIQRRKIRSAVATKNTQLESKLRKTLPRVSLNHLILERYPSYLDALNDLDDPINLISLFASVAMQPNLYRIEGQSNKTNYDCRKLSLEWKNYVIQTHTLKKLF